MIENLIFLRPHFLYLFILPATFWLLAGRKNASSFKKWRQFINPKLLESIPKVKGKFIKSQVVTFLKFLTISLIIIAISGPAIKKQNVKNYDLSSPVVFALDMSQSMQNTDVKPNRLVRAKMKIEEILDKYKDAKYGLVLFTSEAFTVLPLTDDIKVVENFLTHIKPNIMPVYGEINISNALYESLKVLADSDYNDGSILLITDAKIQDLKKENSIRDIKDKGYNVSVLGLSQKTDDIGKVDLNGALHFDVMDPASNFKDLFLYESDFKDFEETMGYEEIGAYLLLPLIVLIPLSYRALLAVFFVLCFSGNAYAEDKEGIAKWFLNNDQQALQAIKSGRYKEAKKQAESQHLKGSAHYKLGEYEEAAKKFFGHDLYNYGNALALTGKYEEAIAAYKKAIELNPKHDDAKHNKEVLEKLMQQQNQSQNDKDKNQKGGQEQEQNGKDNKDGQKDKAQEKDKQSESEAEAEAKPEAEPENDTSGNEKDNQKTEEEKGKQKADRKKNEPMEQDKNPQQESVKFDEKDQAQQNLLRQIEGGSTDFLREKLKLDYLKKKGYNF